MVTYREDGKGKGREGVGMEEVARGEDFIAAGVSSTIFGVRCEKRNERLGRVASTSRCSGEVH